MGWQASVDFQGYSCRCEQVADSLRPRTGPRYPAIGGCKGQAKAIAEFDSDAEGIGEPAQRVGQRRDSLPAGGHCLIRVSRSRSEEDQGGAIAENRLPVSGLPRQVGLQDSRQAVLVAGQREGLITSAVGQWALSAGGDRESGDEEEGKDFGHC